MKCRRWAEVRALQELEARAGIEPAHKGFADLSLTTWVPRLGPGRKPELLHSAAHLVDCCQGGAEWSGRRDLNSRPSPWQGDALPLSYSRLTQVRVYRAAETGSNRLGLVKSAFQRQSSGAPHREIPFKFAPRRRLTHPANSRRLRDCEGCGSFRLPPRIIFPEVRITPATQALEMEAQPWQTTYRRSSAPARP